MSLKYEPSSEQVLASIQDRLGLTGHDESATEFFEASVSLKYEQYEESMSLKYKPASEPLHILTPNPDA